MGQAMFRFCGKGCPEREGTYDSDEDFPVSARVSTRNVQERKIRARILIKLRRVCMERIGTYEIETNCFENHGGTCKNVIRT